MNVLVTGGRGFIGSFLTGLLVARGDHVTIVSRAPDRARTARANERVVGWLPPLEGFDAVVHLAGEPIFGKRWSAQQKENLRTSRVSSTRKLAQSLADLPASQRPRVFVSGSAIGYYGDRGDELLDEGCGPGDDFLAGLCQEWEEAAREAGVRTVLLRTGIVLARGGGALARMLPPFRLGLGGPIGSGRQWMSWIHRRDLARLILHAVDDERLSGPVNGTAPEPVRNRDFARALGRALHRPALFPVPVVALRLVLGEVAKILADSQRCAPARALDSGFEFEFPALDGALRQLLAK
jgi:uncharacterized protein (TIGR01777 family)